MKYQEYTYIDFLEDDYFVQWVLKPDAESELFWKNWLELDPANKQEMLKARRMIEGFGYQHHRQIDKADMQQLHENIIRFNQLHRFNRPEQRRNNTARYWIAAAIALLLMSGVALYLQMYSVEESEPVAEIFHQTTSTVAGLKQTIKLADGTLVKLNAESSLTYPSEFTEGLRVVELKGEAFFEVAEDTNKPFVVRSRGFDTEVLGTSFNIQDYPGEVQQVAVVSGLVKVTTESGASALVNPDQMAVVSETTDRLEITGFDYTRVIGWKDGILRFNNETLFRVFAELERWYGVAIVCRNPELLDDIYEGEFRNETLLNVLNGIGYTSGFTVEEKNGSYFIY